MFPPIYVTHKVHKGVKSTLGTSRIFNLVHWFLCVDHLQSQVQVYVRNNRGLGGEISWSGVTERSPGRFYHYEHNSKLSTYPSSSEFL